MDVLRSVEQKGAEGPSGRASQTEEAVLAPFEETNRRRRVTDVDLEHDMSNARRNWWEHEADGSMVLDLGQRDPHPGEGATIPRRECDPE